MYNLKFFHSKILGFQMIITGLSIFILLITGIYSQAQQSNDYVEGQVIVKLKENVQKTDILAMRESLNAAVIKKFKFIGVELWNISNVTVDEAISQYQGDSRIEYIEPNYRAYAIQTIPNDPKIQQLWGLHNTGQYGGKVDADIDAPEAWTIQTGTDVLVGVIDTGIDWTHEDLADNIWVNPGEIPGNGVDDDSNGYIDDVSGWDFFNGDNNPIDDNGHGTHVSGTIAAVGNNGIGVTGVCWSAKIMPLKFLGSTGAGYFSDAIQAIEYATLMGAKITNNSWSGEDFSQALYDAIKASEEAGMLFIAAAGNNSSNNDIFPRYPASYDLDNIIAVAATNHKDELSSFSNFGKISVDLLAPGSNITSTFPGNVYGALDGTSMATPHVSGVAALIWSQFPNLIALQVKEKILTSVDPIPALADKTVSGGRLNAFNALVSSEQDSIPPEIVTDLATSNPTSNSITLTWTASGDDGSIGMAAYYDIRYSTFSIDAGNFDSATEISGEPTPQQAGSLETFTVTGLAANTTYYFALKVFDEWGNGSPVSNSPSGTTGGVQDFPDIVVTPVYLIQTLSPGDTAIQFLTITNEGAGTLTFDISIEGAGEGGNFISLNSPDFVWMKTREINDRGAGGKLVINRTFLNPTGSHQASLRDDKWILKILRANEQVATILNHSVTEAVGSQLLKPKFIMSAEEIWKSRQNNTSSLTEPIYAVVLDGVGTYLANDRLWDELNANWSHYGDKEILIDYSTFHGIQITYDGLVASGADVVIISNNWDPTDPYGAFSQPEAMAIAQYVNEGAGLYISGGTFNNGEYSELKYHIDYLAPLVGLSTTEKYFWNGNTYGSVNFEVPEHPVLRDITEPYASGWQNKTSIPSTGIWTSASLSTGILVGISSNRQTALVVQGNRVYHSGLPEHISGTESDKQFLYNVIALAKKQTSWLTVNPTQGTVPSSNSADVTVTFDATGLNNGDYTTNIMIVSNDPDENPFVVPVTLTVSDDELLNRVNLAWCETWLGSSAGSQDTVYVCVDDVTNKNIIAYQMEITFDENVLNAIGATSVGTVSEVFGTPIVNTTKDGQITVGGFGTQSLSGSGVLVGLIFDIVGNKGDSTTLCFQQVTFNSGNPTANISNPCCTYEVIDDNNEFYIAGTVRYGITDNPLENVTLAISGGASKTQITGADGDYLFKNLQKDLNYIVAPTLAGNFSTNSISSYDAAITAQHAVGSITLTAEQQKAADVDGDGNILIFDASLICRFAVGLPPFNENDCTGEWRFNPISRSYTPLNSIKASQDYAAALLGDVDGNWTPGTLAMQPFAGEKYEYLTKLVTNPGDELTIPLMVEEENKIISADIDFEFDPKILQFSEITRTVLSKEFEVITNVENGRLRIGAYGTEEVRESGVLLLLKFKVIGNEEARSPLTLKRFQINNGLVKHSDAELIVATSTPEIPAKFALNQNYPNPFNSETNICIDVPEHQGENITVKISIYEVLGKLVRVLTTDEFSPGTHEIQWDGRNEMGQPVPSGVYFYTMFAGSFQATKKMIVIR